MTGWIAPAHHRLAAIVLDTALILTATAQIAGGPSSLGCRSRWRACCAPGVGEMKRISLFALLLLCSCATAPPPPPQYIVRPTGRTPQARMQSVLTQCQGEAAATPQSLYLYGGLLGLAGTLAARAAQDNAIVSACMARNGYPKGTY